MVTKGDYEDKIVAAVRAVLAEVFRAFGEYRDRMVLIGGWAPTLLIPDSTERHQGSLDVDIALDHQAIDDDCYARISKILAELGFVADENNRFRFGKTIDVEGAPFVAFVDLLAAEYGGTGKARRHQKVQDVEPRKVRGCDLALQSPVELNPEMTLPSGAKATVRLRVTGIAAFIAMKAFALDDRSKDKDAYDIVFCLRNYLGGIEAVAADFQQFGDHGLVREALGILADVFESPEHTGPVAYATYQELPRGEERDAATRDASERVLELIKRIREA